MEKETRVVHCKIEPYDVYIGRPGPWGNPYSHKEGTLAKYRVVTVEEAVTKYEEHLRSNAELLAYLPELRGKTLGCWCRAGKPCHGQVIVRILGEMTDDQLRSNTSSPKA